MPLLEVKDICYSYPDGSPALNGRILGGINAILPNSRPLCLGKGGLAGLTGGKGGHNGC